MLYQLLMCLFFFYYLYSVLIMFNLRLRIILILLLLLLLSSSSSNLETAYKLEGVLVSTMRFIYVMEVLNTSSQKKYVL